MISLTFRGWRHTPQARAGKCRPALFCVFLFYPFGICPDRTPDNLRILFYWFGRRLIAWPGSVRELLNRAGAASDTERCAGRTLCTNNAGNVRKTCDFVQKNDQNARFPCKSHAFSIKKRALSAGNHFRQNRGGPVSSSPCCLHKIRPHGRKTAPQAPTKGITGTNG